MPLPAGGGRSPRPSWLQFSTCGWTFATRTVAFSSTVFSSLPLAQACNNRWSNHRLLAACALLPVAFLRTPQPAAFFGSLWALLGHLLDVDRFYLDALHDQPRPYQDTDWPDLGALRAAQSASDQRLIALCRNLGSQQLTQLITLPRASGPVREGDCAPCSISSCTSCTIAARPTPCSWPAAWRRRNWTNSFSPRTNRYAGRSWRPWGSMKGSYGGLARSSNCLYRGHAGAP